MQLDRTSLSNEDYKKLLTLEQISALKADSGFQSYMEDANKYRLAMMQSVFNSATTTEQYLEIRGIVRGLDFLLGYVGTAKASIDEMMSFEDELAEEEY